MIAAPTNTRVENPLLDRTLLTAVERFGVSPTAVGGRSALLALLFGRVIDDIVCWTPTPVSTTR